MNYGMLTICLFGMTSLLGSCQSTLEGEGPVKKEIRPLSPFRRLELEMPAEVSYIVSDSNSVEVIAQSNLLPHIITEVHGEKLTIEASSPLRTGLKIKLVVRGPAPEKAELNGSGEINFVNEVSVKSIDLEVNGSGDMDVRLAAGQTEVHLNGSGAIHLIGSSRKLVAVINGSGELRAIELRAEEVSLDIHGSGEAFVTAEKKLKSTINGSGKIIYKGDPALKNQINGSGSIQKRDTDE